MMNLFPYILVGSIFLQSCFFTLPDKKQVVQHVDSLPVLPTAPVVPSPYYKAADTFYTNILEKSGFSGAFLVAKNGEIVYEKYNGYSYPKTKTALGEHCALHLASVSKTFTAMGILKLYEQGKLYLEDEVSVYIDGFNYKGVTIKTLLNHRSGLPNYGHVMEQNGWNRNQLMYNKDVVDFLIKYKHKLQVAKADKSFQYCNTNYALLASIIEKVSGMPYPQFMQETFFTPLEMNDSYVFTMADSSIALPSFNHKNEQEAFTYLDAVYGDKNIYSTARDLLKWENALSYGNLFSPATLQEAYKGYSYEKKGVKNYGLGWRLLEYPNNKKIVFHNGWWHGNNTVFTRLIQDSATIIILGNRYNRNIYQARRLFDAFGDYDPEEDTE